MARYEVELVETVYHDPLWIQAESEEEAGRKAREAWENGEMTNGESDLKFDITKTEDDDGEHMLD